MTEEVGEVLGMFGTGPFQRESIDRRRNKNELVICVCLCVCVCVCVCGGGGSQQVNFDVRQSTPF